MAIPAAATIGPIVIGRRGPMRCASRPIRAESSNITTVTGSNALPACDRREARDALQRDRQQEQRAGECGVDDERHDVGAGELARCGTGQRHHRIAHARLVEQEPGKHGDAAEQRGDQSTPASPARDPR